MFPDLISIGPFTIHTYGFFVALGFAVGIWTAVKVGKRQGIPSQQVMDMAFVMIVWAIIGSRLFYVLINFSYYKTHPLDIIKLWQGGLVFSGGLVATAAAMLWYLRRHHGPHENQGGEKLRGGHFSCSDEAALVASKALHQEASGAVQNQVPEEDLSLELAFSVEIDQDQENREPAEGFKYLGRVKRNVERGKGFRMGKHHAP